MGHVLICASLKEVFIARERVLLWLVSSSLPQRNAGISSQLLTDAFTTYSSGCKTERKTMVLSPIIIHIGTPLSHSPSLQPQSHQT